MYTLLMWLSLSYRIIRAFEVMVALITQENIDDFMIEGDNAALMVERVSVIRSSLSVYKLSACIFFHWLLSWLLHK